MKHLRILVSLVLVVGITPPVFTAEDQKPDEGIKNYGVVFNIAKDRKIEKIGGIYEPEGIDKYIDRRLTEVTEQIRKLQTQIEELNQKLDTISLKLSENTPAPPPLQKAAASS